MRSRNLDYQVPLYARLNAKNTKRVSKVYVQFNNSAEGWIGKGWH